MRPYTRNLGQPTFATPSEACGSDCVLLRAGAILTVRARLYGGLCRASRNAVRSALSSLRDENLCIIRARRSVMRSLPKKTPRTPYGLRFSGGAKRRPTQPLVRRRPRNHESVHSRLFSKVYPEVGLQQYSVLLLIPYLPFLTSLSGRHDQTAIGQRDTPVRCRQ